MKPSLRWLKYAFFPVINGMLLVCLLKFYPTLGILPIMGLILLDSIFFTFSIHVSFHEAVHHFRPQNAWLKNLYSAAASILSGFPITGYFIHHLNHHTHNNSLEDYSSTWKIKNNTVVAQNPFAYAFLWWQQSLRAGQDIRRRRQEGLLRDPLKKQLDFEKLTLLVFYVLLATYSFKALLLYFTTIYVGWVVASFCNYGQHLPADPQGLRHTFSFHHRLFNILTVNNGYHAEHHERPSVPTDKLQAQKDLPLLDSNYFLSSIRFKPDGVFEIQFDGVCDQLAERSLLCQRVLDFHRKAIAKVQSKFNNLPWTLDVPGNLLFDSGGLEIIAVALQRYRGEAGQLSFQLEVSPEAARDYYSFHSGLETGAHTTLVKLPGLTAQRKTQALAHSTSEELTLKLPEFFEDIPFPKSLAEKTLASVPQALVMLYSHNFDLLFANQIALVSHLASSAKINAGKSLRTLWTFASSASTKTFKKRVALGFTSVHPSAEVHPTAVLEGAIVGAGARIGAHCVVRFSLIGENARLHDGAKVEFSTVGPNSWLMHDLVLYRSHTEADVFLIHGPYQFSAFHAESAAFATILMDYRADAKPFRIHTESGIREYRGRFLGSIYGSRSKTLGGSLVAPAREIPPNVWLSPRTEDIHTLKNTKDLLRNLANSPQVPRPAMQASQMPGQDPQSGRCNLPTPSTDAPVTG